MGERRERRGYLPSGASSRQRAAIVEQIIEAYGSDCFFCGEPTGEAATVEHLAARGTHGGERASKRNRLSNLRMAHKVCNNAAANLPRSTKFRVRQHLAETGRTGWLDIDHPHVNRTAARLAAGGVPGTGEDDGE